MSWIESLKSGMKITTGDGVTYDVLSVVGSNKYAYEFNVSEFEFPEVIGTRVDRRLPKGRRFPLEFYFQGELNFEQSETFRISANNKAKWIVLHPIYGQISGHPISLSFDHSGINISKITCEFVESIDDDGPKTIMDSKESALIFNEATRELNNEAVSSIDVEASDVVLMNSNATTIFDAGINLAPDDDSSANYLNAFNKATNKINTAVNGLNEGVNVIQNFITYPAQFKINVKSRISMIKSQLSKLSNKISNITSFNEKKIHENNAGALITAALESSLTPIEGDYENSVDVVFVIDEILGLHNTYISELESLQDDNGFELESYLPDSEFLFNLNQTVYFTVSNLLNIAVNSLQQRVVYLEENSNIINLTHRFLGMDDQDETLFKFINDNSIKQSEILQIEKGRKIVYYV